MHGAYHSRSMKTTPSSNWNQAGTPHLMNPQYPPPIQRPNPHNYYRAATNDTRQFNQNYHSKLDFFLVI